MFRQRLRVVSKFACWLAVQFFDMLYSQSLQQSRNSHTTNRIDSIDRHTEIGSTDGLDIDQIKFQHLFYMALSIVSFLNARAKRIDIGKNDIGTLGQVEHLSTLLFIKKFALFVEHFERIPLFWIMRSGENNTTIGTLESNRKFGGWSSCKTNVDHITTTSHQCAYNDVRHHIARQTCIATNHHRAILFATIAFQPLGIACSKLHNINRRKTLAHCATYSATNTRN